MCTESKSTLRQVLYNIQIQNLVTVVCHTAKMINILLLIYIHFIDRYTYTIHTDIYINITHIFFRCCQGSAVICIHAISMRLLCNVCGKRNAKLHKLNPSIFKCFIFRCKLLKEVKTRLSELTII